MPGLQSLLEKFVTTTHGYTTDSETVFSHPLTDARIALATDDETIRALAVYGWIVAEPSLEPSFNVLPALQRTFPELLSQHPDELDRLLAPDSVAKLIEAQQVEHRGRMARWLLGRSRSTGNTELAKWTREACADIAIQSSHPLAPRLDRPTYIQGPESLGRITGSELTGYQLLLVASSNGRTMLSSAPTMDELFAPNVEWTAAQWIAYEQLLRAIPCSEQTFATQVNALRADAACHSQHLWAIQQGTAAYLGTATDDLRRRFRHSPSSQWLDSASAETGISLRSAGGMNRLIDLYMVEHLTDSEVLEHIVPAMRDADSDFAELSDTALAAIWRSAYNPILNSVLRASADEAVRLRVGETPPAIKSSPEAMRGLLSSYYGEAPIATLELAGKLHLVSTVDDLPPSLQDEVYLIGGRDRVSGITFEGAVYLIGANTAPEDVCSVFLHEVGEHAALRSMLGRDYGRIVQRFNHLLSEGDTYAVQASMQVPNSTAPSNLDSEHLAHLIQLAAADIEAKEGGEGGFDLGQRCIRDLRTWLYRTPLMRELERQGELEDFKLDAHDIATLAREAVDFHVADIQHSTTALNQWDSKLDSDFISVLHKQTVSERVNALQHLPLEQQIAYVYALGTMQATDGAETLVRMAGAVAEASNSADEVTRLLASEVSALTLRLSTQSRASRHLDTQGLFAAISGTDTPSASVLTLIRSAPNGKWVAEHYQNGLGLTLLEDFDTKEAAVQILGQHHFPVQSKELDSVIARWGSAIAAEHRQLDSQAFKRWFAGSVTRYSDGTPMVLYHGTAKNFSKANGIFWASAPTPAEQRPAPAQAPAPIVELQKVETPFDQWFGASKIVDEGGKPLTLYHGTSASFNAFKVSLYGAIGTGVYTTPNAGDAQIYGDRLVDLHANLVNPLIGTFAEVRAMQYANETSEKFTERLIGLGYDGVATTDATGRFDYVVAFQPEQLKSASQNNGMYDRSNPDIRFRDMPQHGSPTETVAFKNWFDGSSITDQQGQPLVVYHGTDADFTSFKAGPNYFTTRTDYSFIRNCDVVMPVYLNIKNPYRPESQHEIESIRSNPERYEELKGLGYDGMLWSAPGNMMKGASGWGNDLPQIVTFYPNQIKSAIGNVGSFDRASNDIRFKQKHAVQTSTPEFQQWFGESKLVAPSGEPMVVYHGTNMDFSVFNTNSVQSRFPYSFGFHFTDQRNEASTYADSITNAAAGFNPASPYVKPSMEGGNVMPVFIRAENPLIIKTDQLSASIEADINRAEIVTQLEEARAAGQPYDSVIIKRERGDEYDGLNVIVFNPNQIKSAIGNAGSFDRASNDIRFKLQNPVPLTSLPTFKDWFVRSMVVDAAGAPLVVYHGSHKDFTVFEQQESAHFGFHFGNAQAANTRLDDTAEKHFDNAEFIRLHERATKFWMDMQAFRKSLEEKSAKPSTEMIIADAARQGKELWEVIGDYTYQPNPIERAQLKELEDRFKEANVISHKYGEGSHINSFYLSLQRPLRLPDVGDWGTPDTVAMELPWGSDATTFEEIVDEIKEHGYDGIVYLNTVENLRGEQADSYIAFDPEQIKSAYGNVGTFDKDSPDVRFAFAGAAAQTAERQLLASAKVAIEAGADAEQVRQETGWFQGSDSKWRFELDDNQLKARESWNLWGQNKTSTTFRAHDLIDHWPLFDAYPQLRYLKVTVEPGLAPDTAVFFPLDSSISLGAEPEEGLLTLSMQQLSALAHELQHGIQEIERFSHGGSASDEALPTSRVVLKTLNETYRERKQALEQSAEYAEHIAQVLSAIPPGERMRQGARGEYDHGQKVANESAYNLFIEPLEEERLSIFDRLVKLEGPMQGADSRMLSYRLLAGEVEARNVQARLHFSAAERMARSPQDTQDAPEQSVYDWHEDEVRLASLIRAQSADSPVLPTPSAKLRFAYSDNGIRTQMDALADFYTQSDEYQFDQYEKRERITDQLIEQLAGNEQFIGMVLPVAFGFTAITQSAKQPGAWQVTALDASFAPLSDEGTQSKAEALATFFGQFDTASASAVIAGATADISLADTHVGLNKALKGSTLADEYAELRQDMARYSQPALEADRALVMPVYLNVKTPFDGDKLSTSSLKVGELRDELVRQTEASGRHIDVMLVASLVKTITKAARVEESGPYYRRHDFWMNRTSHFGGAGAAALQQLFTHCGFDSIKLTENDHLTFGVFSAAQVKSASGNTGLYSANPDIRFAFAGTNAATSDLSRLKQAKLLAEQDVSADDIWKSTGWMFGADGDWRFEIDDSKARIRGYDHEKDEAEVTTTEPDRFVDWVEESIHRRSGVPLSQFYDHPELYAAYPQLAKLNVVAVERMPGDETLGSFGFHRSFAQSTLYVAAPYTLRSDGPTFEEVLAHETQHCIQHIEGFGPGAMVSDFESDQTTSDELKSSMLAYIEIHDHSKSLGCTPEKFAELSGYSQQIIERVGTWRQQGNWDSNVTSFRRSVMSPFELYFHEAGEVEARNTQHRIDMSAEQRAVKFPLDTIDVESSLIKVSRKFRVFANSTMAPEATAYGRADSAFEWAIKTQGWRTGLNDNAQLLHAGKAMNLFAVKTDAASRTYHGEIFAVALDDSVIGSFLYGPAPEGAGQHLNAAAMVHPDFRRQGVASTAYNAIESLTGKKLVPSLANTSSSAKAFWEARQAPATKNATVGDSNALSQWMRQSSTVGADGKPTVFYHGTMAAFENFDAARHRSILNNGYQGDAFHFSPSPDVASSYATAARNQLFRQFDLYQAAEKALPPTITQLLKGLVEEGHAIWAKYSEDEFCNMRDMCLSKGFDINDLMDLSEYVEGSAGIHPRENINLFAEHHDCDMPDDIKDLAVTLGLADAVPVPIVMPVYLRCENTLYTDDKQQARDAQSNGYDSVCYSGDGTVGQDPEWMVFHTANIRSVFEFEQDAKVLMQEHSNPLSPVPGASITPPASTLFDHWFEGSSCINQFGEPRLVFVRDNPGNAFNTFADLNAASPDAQGKVTPAILAIRSPFIVTDSAHIAITDLNDKLGRRKAGLIVGDLLRDGQLGIEDIIKNPRCNKWIQQAGYDGAIYRNRDGENRYVTFDVAQAVVGSAIQRTLNESSQWGPVPAAPAMSFVGDRARARQFTLSNHGKPHGHVVPMSAADQYLANSDRLYVNHLGNIRLSATNIAAMCEATDTPKHLSEFLTRNRKGLAGKARIEDIFAEHIRSLRQGINQARMDARADTPQASYQRNMVDKLSNALVWAIEHSSSGKSFKGLVSEDLLQWNKPLSQQSPMVLQVLSTLGINGLYQVVGSGTLQLKTCNRYTADEFTRDYPDGRVEQIDAAGLTGRACFEELANDLGGSKQAADLLSSMGITGAQQSTAEVLLFKPSFTHAPLLPLALCKPTPDALNGDSLAIQDLGGVMIKGGVHTACKSLWGNQERALEVVESAIHLLSTRHSQLADFSSPLAVNDQHNKQQLAEAKALQQELMFTAIPSQFLPWADPLSEQHLKTLSPVIKIDPAHALPGSAVFRLIAGRQEGIEGAKAMLSKVGIVGVCTEDATLAWSTGARTVCKTVAADTPIAGYAFADVTAKSSQPNLSMM